MRNIAARLGVGTMTLYTWVQNKDDLVDAMSDALSARLLVPEPLPADWPSPWPPATRSKPIRGCSAADDAAESGRTCCGTSTSRFER